nr:hypothetical protein [Tanacetum cinerariifolium]
TIIIITNPFRTKNDRGTSELILDTDSEGDELREEDTKEGKEDESLDADDEGQGLDDKGHGLEDEGPGTEEEKEAALEGQ